MFSKSLALVATVALAAAGTLAACTSTPADSPPAATSRTTPPTTPATLGHDCEHVEEANITKPVSGTVIVRDSDVDIVVNITCLPKGWGLHQVDRLRETDGETSYVVVNFYSSGWAVFSGTTVTFRSENVGGVNAISFLIVAGPMESCIKTLRGEDKPTRKLPAACEVAASGAYKLKTV